LEPKGLTEVAFEAMGAGDLVETNKRSVAYTAEGVVKNMTGHMLISQRKAVVDRGGYGK
jgi:hypothetical protein